MYTILYNNNCNCFLFLFLINLCVYTLSAFLILLFNAFNSHLFIYMFLFIVIYLYLPCRARLNTVGDQSTQSSLFLKSNFYHIFARIFMMYLKKKKNIQKYWYFMSGYCKPHITDEFGLFVRSSNSPLMCSRAQKFLCHQSLNPPEFDTKNMQ